MADFDPQDVVSTVPAPRAQSDFDPKDVHSEVPQASGGDFDPEDVHSIAEPTQSQEETTKPSGVGGMLTEQDMQAIAQKHGVNYQELKDIAPYYGAISEPVEPGTREPSLTAALKQGVKGTLGHIPLLGEAGQLIYKKLQDPNMRGALDEIKEIGSGQMSGPSKIAEAVLTPVPVGKALGAAGRVATAAGVGAGFGVLGSKEGEEFQAARKGAVIGGIIGGGAEVLGAVVNKLAKTAAERAAAQKLLEETAPKIDEEVGKIQEARAASEDIIEHAISKPDTVLTPVEVDTIAKEQINPDVLDPATEEGALLKERLGAGYSKEAAARVAAEDLVESRARSFAEHLTGDRPKTGEEASKAIDDYASRQGPEATAKQYRTFQVADTAMKYIEANGIRVEHGAEDFGGKSANFLSDAQFPMRVIDARGKFPLSAEKAVQDLNVNNNRFAIVREDLRKNTTDALFNKFPEVREQIRNGTIPDAIRNGTVESLAPREQEAANEMSRMWEEGRQYVNEGVRTKDPTISPLNIPKQENYVPDMTLPTEEAAVAVQQQIGKALDQATQSLGRPVTSLAQVTPVEYKALAKVEGPLQDLQKAVHMFDAKNIGSGQELSLKLRDTFEGRAGAARLQTKANAALEKQNAIPDFLKERNGFRLMDRWNQNTLRHLFLREPLDRLQAISNMADKAGDKLGSGYINRFLQDMNGVRAGTAAAYTKAKVMQWQKACDSVIRDSSNPLWRKAAEWGRVLPEFNNDVYMQLYPNLIGLNPKSHIQHIIQPFAKMWPELGMTPYGLSTILRGMCNTVINLPTRLRQVSELGLEGSSHIASYRRATATGFRASGLYSAGMTGLGAIGKPAMYAYGKIFSLNKALAISVGETMASDLAHGVAGAQRSVSLFPRPIQRAIAMAPTAAEKADLITKHLNSTSVYNYSRASMSEFGRTMGPLFSTFSKWPLATAGDITSAIRTKGWARGTAESIRKYGSVIGGLELAQYLLFGAPDDMSDRQKKIIGHSGLVAMAPGMSLMETFKRGGEGFAPPAVDALIKTFVMPTIHGDPDMFHKGLGNTMQQFLPGSVYVRFMTDDLPTYLTGHRPGGSDFIERTQEGIKKWER